MLTSTSYPKTRVWFGIISIGGNLFLPWIVYLGIVQGFISFSGGSNVALTIIGYFFMVLLLNLAWDLLTGFIWEKRAQRYSGDFKNWAAHWATSALTVLFLQCCGGLMLALIAENLFPPFFGILIVGFFLLGLAWSLHHYHFHWIPAVLKKPYAVSETYQKELEQQLFTYGFSLKNQSQLLYFYQSEDGSTVNGGSIGGGTQRRYMISSASVEQLAPAQLALLIWRDEKISSSQLQNLCCALGYCLLGLLLAGASLYFVGSSFWERWFWLVSFLSSWFFLALFLWPSYSRRNYLSVDRKVIEAGIDPKFYEALLEKLQILNLTEREVPSWIEFVFYPIPSLEKRLSLITQLSQQSHP